MQAQPRTIQEFISELRASLVCDRCGRYVGSLSPERYVPPPYPVGLDRIGDGEEVQALIGFEWHMLQRMQEGNFVIRHPARDGQCITYRDWIAAEDEDDADEGARE